jgi:hypothetical protein
MREVLNPRKIAYLLKLSILYNSYLILREREEKRSISKIPKYSVRQKLSVRKISIEYNITNGTN